MRQADLVRLLVRILPVGSERRAVQLGGSTGRPGCLVEVSTSAHKRDRPHRVGCGLSIVLPSVFVRRLRVNLPPDEAARLTIY